MNAQQLKNSILQMAVSGKLVPQEPNDEPASVLLERIRKEKEDLIKAGKIKREKNSSYIFRGSDNTPYEKIGNNEPVSIADKVPFEIPDSWGWARLRDIVYNRGQKKPENDFCYIDIGSIDNENQRLNKKDTILSPKGAPSRARKIVDYGDILYSTVRPYLHNMCIIDKIFSHTPIASTGFAAITCLDGINNEFLFLFLMSPSFDSYANDTENSKGVAYPAINDARLYQAFVPIPPEKEQKRIVETFNILKPYISNYKKVDEKLTQLNSFFPDQLKKSILQQAVQGKLVPQDPADEPASVLLERIRAEKERLITEGKIKRDKNESVIYRRDNSHYEKINGIEHCIDDEIPFDIPDSWEWRRFKEVITIASNLVSPENYLDYAHIAPDNIEKGTGRLLEYRTVREDSVKSVNHFFYKGQLLYSKIRPALQKATVAPCDGLCSADMYPLDTILYPEYVLVFLLSETFTSAVVKDETRVKMPKTNQNALNMVLIPIPPYVEQIKIATMVQRMTNILQSLR